MSGFPLLAIVELTSMSGSVEELDQYSWDITSNEHNEPPKSLQAISVLSSLVPISNDNSGMFNREIFEEQVETG